MARLFSLFMKALLPRFLFLGHGMVGIFVLTLTQSNSNWWALSAFLILIVFEGIYNVLVRKGKEFDWFCPSAFFYSIVLLTVLFYLRNDMVDCIVNGTPDDLCGIKRNVKNAIEKLVYYNSIGGRAAVIEQTGVFMLIIGRWTLPKGSISRDQFSQILLIYVGTAADIVEFSELYSDEQVRLLPSKETQKQIYRGVMVVWGWSILQFSLTIALPEDGLKHEEEEDVEQDPANVKWRQTNRVAPISYLHYKQMLTKGWDTEAQKTAKTEKYAIQWRGKFENSHPRQQAVVDEHGPEEEESGCGIKRGELKECVLNHLELITCLVPVLMQDGPFFVYRMILMVKYKISTQMIILLTVKNALVIIVQIYRIMILYCCEPRQDEPELDDPSIRVRTALKASQGLSKRSMKSVRGSVAIQAISRMQSQYLHHKSGATVS